MNKTSLLFVLSLAGLSMAILRAESPEQPAAPVTAPAASVAPQPAMIPHPMTAAGPQSALPPEQMEILNQARTELQQDPELMELTAQIKALVEKRSKLAEEKLQKINPEAAALLQQMKATQEKMMAERKAQMEAMQAKMKTEHEASQSPAP